MIFHEFFHYIGLPPQSIDQKPVLWKSIISREKHIFWGSDFWPTWPMLTKPIQDQAPELKLSPPGFFNIPDRSKTTPGPQEAPNTSKNQFFENYKNR